MALDVQSNWNAEMSKPAKNTLGDGLSSLPDSKDTLVVPVLSNYSSNEIRLPAEVLIQIIAFIPRNESNQKTLWACCLVSRLWYSSAITHLYERPYLGGRNFHKFVDTVCPSKNAHIRRSYLAELVHKLDMGELVHDGSKSLTARLLGRLKGGITHFVAPQASFSVNSLAALSKCTSLVHLDLSLMSASIPMKLLFQALRALINLETLFFPRSSSNSRDQDSDPYVWPPKLRVLHLAGGIDNLFLREHVCNTPSSLERLSIQHCSQIYSSALEDTLKAIGPRLQHLTVRFPMTKLPIGALNDVLVWCPNLVAIRISADYLTEAFLGSDQLFGHPLRVLDLDCSESAGMEVGISPDRVWLAIHEGILPKLRSVLVSARLAWQATETLRASVSDLVDLLLEQEEQEPLKIATGVWTTPT